MRNFRPLSDAATAQNPILAQSTNFSTDYAYESIAKEDMRLGLLADESPRETLIEIEHPGSALLDDLVSLIIGLCKFVKERMKEGFTKTVSPIYARVAKPPSAVHQVIRYEPQPRPCNDLLWTAGALACEVRSLLR